MTTRDKVLALADRCDAQAEDMDAQGRDTATADLLNEAATALREMREALSDILGWRETICPKATEPPAQSSTWKNAPAKRFREGTDHDRG